MKYKETSKFPKSVGLTGLYSIIAVALVAIGAFSWVMVARAKARAKLSENGKNSGKQSGYSSYNDYVSDYFESDPQVESAEGPAEDIPDTREEVIEQPLSFSMPVKGSIVKNHSEKTLQFSKTFGDMRLHFGIDIECEKNSEIASMGEGRVKEITDNALLGTVITVEHSGGISTKYCGMGKVFVKEGDSLSSGTVLGTIGTVPGECADKCHLHLEVFKDGISVEPQSALGW